ncbi:unnamed protein product [Gordionus sp. m RMFG-2023]
MASELEIRSEVKFIICGANKYKKVGCKASCKFDGNYTTSGLHEHQNEIGHLEKLRTRKVLEDIVAKNLLETRDNIYEKALNQRCLETPSIKMYPEAMPLFVSIKSTIDKLLQKNMPTLPQSVDELTNDNFAIEKKNIFPRYGHHAMLCLLNIFCSKILWSVWILHGSVLMPYSPKIYGPGIKLMALEQTTTWRGIIMPSREKQT